MAGSPLLSFKQFFDTRSKESTAGAAPVHDRSALLDCPARRHRPKTSPIEDVSVRSPLAHGRHDADNPLLRSQLVNRAILVLALLLVNVPVSGQSATPSGDLGQASGWLALSAEQRGRTERLTNIFRRNGAGSGRTLALRTRVRADLGRRSGRLQGLVEIQDARSTLTDEPFLVPAVHTNELDLLQLQVRVGADNIRGGDLDSEIRFGRFTLDLGRRRLVARNRMRNTTNAFDGAVWRLESPERWRLHILASRPVLIEPEALDSSHGAGTFWGSYYEQTMTHGWGYEVYAFVVREPADAVLARRHVTLGGGSRPGHRPVVSISKSKAPGRQGQSSRATTRPTSSMARSGTHGPRRGRPASRCITTTRAAGPMPKTATRVPSTRSSGPVGSNTDRRGSSVRSFEATCRRRAHA